MEVPVFMEVPAFMKVPVFTLGNIISVLSVVNTPLPLERFFSALFCVVRPFQTQTEFQKAVVSEQLQKLSVSADFTKNILHAI